MVVSKRRAWGTKPIMVLDHAFLVITSITNKVWPYALIILAMTHFFLGNVIQLFLFGSRLCDLRA
jgi:hypothetical protein